MIHRLIARWPRGRRSAAAPPDPYAGVDLTDTVLVDSIAFRGLPCSSSRCGGCLTIHRLTSGSAVCGVCEHVRPAAGTAEERKTR